jgi:tRNA(fMet)-specific endonuclease VapC
LIVAILSGRAVMMSIVTRVGLEGGVSAVPSISFDHAAANAYGTIVAKAGYSRRKLLDRMIAAQALVHRTTLVTMNAVDYTDIPGLSVLAW